MNSRIHITDHAIVRYLERIKGFDVQAIRQELELPFRDRRLDSATEQFRGSEYKVKSDRMVMVVKKNTVVTCYAK